MPRSVIDHKWVYCACCAIDKNDEREGYFCMRYGAVGCYRGHLGIVEVSREIAIRQRLHQRL